MPERKPLGGPARSYKGGPMINDGKHPPRTQAHPGKQVSGQSGFRDTPIIRSPVDLDVSLPLRASGTHGSNQNSENIGVMYPKHSSAPVTAHRGKGASGSFQTATKGKKLYD